jgi:hypothetical protein
MAAAVRLQHGRKRAADGDDDALVPGSGERTVEVTDDALDAALLHRGHKVDYLHEYLIFPDEVRGNGSLLVTTLQMRL